VDLSCLRARQVSAKDIIDFDYVLAMDLNNLAILKQLAPEHLVHKPRLFLDFAPDLIESEVPDPYYGGEAGFLRVLDLIEAASVGLLEHIRREHNL